MRFLLLLLLCSGLCGLLLGGFVGLPLLCTTHHSPRSGSRAYAFARLIVSNRPNRGTAGSTPGSTPYTPSFRLLGIVRGGLLLCFLLFLRFGCWGWSLEVDSRLLFGSSKALVLILQLLVCRLLLLRICKHANALRWGRHGLRLLCCGRRRCWTACGRGLGRKCCRATQRQKHHCYQVFDH